jgi:hypothetical protein
MKMEEKKIREQQKILELQMKREEILAKEEAILQITIFIIIYRERN